MLQQAFHPCKQSERIPPQLVCRNGHHGGVLANVDCLVPHRPRPRAPNKTAQREATNASSETSGAASFPHAWVANPVGYAAIRAGALDGRQLLPGRLGAPLRTMDARTPGRVGDAGRVHPRLRPGGYAENPRNNRSKSTSNGS